MSDFQDQVELLTGRALISIRQWNKKQVAEEIMRDYLSEEGMITKSGSKLEELLDERHRLSLGSEDENIKLKAIDSALNMASGSAKVTNVQNNQFNFPKFLDDIE